MSTLEVYDASVSIDFDTLDALMRNFHAVMGAELAGYEVGADDTLQITVDGEEVNTDLYEAVCNSVGQYTTVVFRANSNDEQDEFYVAKRKLFGDWYAEQKRYTYQLNQADEPLPCLLGVTILG